ncbi:SRPBCC family protein [Cellulomonas sp. P22]|uniref:SRPBCC family protein n=1 Tax=Cellulomonas sp. P22 TaxID=3373189 RepID=UPI0037982793
MSSRGRAARLTLACLGVAVGVVLARRESLRWGATEGEVAAGLPGDDLVPDPQLVATRAISVRTSPAEVWPWIVQMGQGRAGFYSYDLLENLVGCDIHSADRIVPEWQELAVGDEVLLHPDGGLRVEIVDPGRAFVLRGAAPAGSAPAPYEFSWAFVLRDAPGGTTRLVVRERYGYTQPWSALLVEPVEWVSLLMSQRMLRGVKQRAELEARGPAA